MTTETEQLARAFKALAHPNRLRIYQQVAAANGDTLSDSGCKVVDFINALKIGAPTVSHHVKELVNAGLIVVERDGRSVTCRLNQDMRKRLGQFFD